MSVKLRCIDDNSNDLLLVDSVQGLSINRTVASVSATQGALVIHGGLSIHHTTDAVSVTSGGAVTIDGGVAIGKSLFVGGALIAESINSNSSGTAAFGKITLNNTENIVSFSTGALISKGGINIQNTANALGTTYGGAFMVAGGAAIQKDVYIGGDLTVSGTQTNIVTQTLNVYDNLAVVNASPISSRDAGVLVQRFQLENDTGTGDIVLGTATLQLSVASASTGTLELSSGASNVNDAYNNWFLKITSGAGINQVRKIVDYNGGTKIATLNSAFTTVPSNSDTVSLYDKIYLGQFYQESENAFAIGFTANDPGASTVTVGGYAPLHVGTLRVRDTANATTASNGVLQVSGGVSIQKDTRIGGSLFTGSIVNTTASGLSSAVISYVSGSSGSILVTQPQTGQSATAGNFNSAVTLAKGYLTTSRTRLERIYVNGNFTSTSPITFDDYTGLHIEGKVTVPDSVITGSADGIVFGTNTQGSVLHHCELQGGVISGDETAQSGYEEYALVRFYNCGFVKVSGTKFCNSSASGLALEGTLTYASPQDRNVSIIGCVSENNQGSGFLVAKTVAANFVNCRSSFNVLDGWDFSRSPAHCSVTNCYAFGNSQDGIAVQDGFSMTLSNSVVYNNQTGIHVTGFSGGSREIQVLGNNVYSNSESGIHLSATVGNTLNRILVAENMVTNHSTGTAYGIRLGDYIEDITLATNTVYKNDYGIYANNTLVSTGSVIRITDNSLRQNTVNTSNWSQAPIVNSNNWIGLVNQGTVTGNVTCNGDIDVSGNIRANSGSITTGSIHVNTQLVSNGGYNKVGNVFTTSGNVGINTSSPGYQLDVNGSVNITGDLEVTGSINGSGSSSSTFSYLTITATDEALNLTSGALVTFGGVTIQCPTDSVDASNGGALLTEGGAAIGKKMVVGGGLYSPNANTLGTLVTTTNGNIGIGTAAPTTVLDIQLGSNTLGFVDNSGVPTIVSNTSAVLQAPGITLSSTSPSSTFLAISNSAGALQTVLNVNGSASYLLSGNVGIGTSAPSQRLHVSGNMLTTQTANTASSYMAAMNGSGAAGGLQMYGNAGVHFGIVNNTSGVFVTNNTTSNISNVGIGTTTPQYKLDVHGIGQLTSALISSTTNATGIGSGGSFTVAGGAAVAQDLYIGGNLYVGTKNIKLISGNATVGSNAASGVYTVNVPLGETMGNTNYTVTGTLRTTATNANVYTVSFSNVTTTSFNANVLRLDALFAAWTDPNLQLSWIVMP